jgi:APA family basic amino acid/polyamine antiporter
LKNKLDNSELKREVVLFSATVLVVANMVGTGIFTTSGFIIQELQNPQSLLLCWLVGGIFALCGALSYGELGAMFPRAGGEYVYLRESFGKWMGFLSGWISLIVGFSAAIAAAAIAFAAYFSIHYKSPLAQRLPSLYSESLSAKYHHPVWWLLLVSLPFRSFTIIASWLAAGFKTG